MTTLNKIFKILQLEKKEDKKVYLFKPTRPQKEVIFNEYHIPNSRSKKCTKEKLSKVLAFIDMIKRMRFSEGLTVMPISSNGKRLLSICGSQRNSSNLIKYMKEIGLIASYNEEYQFNAYYNKDNKCKEYCYNKEVEDKIKEYCKDNEINMYQIKNRRRDTIVEKFKPLEYSDKIKSFEDYMVRFSSKVHFLKPDNYTNEEFEEYLLYCLYENYPMLEYYQNMADEINETYFSDDYRRQIRFVPNFTWNKDKTSVIKIGIRATNMLVSTKNEHEEGEKDYILHRDEVLNEYGFDYEFDVTSSVPRITYLLNRGKWLNNNIDLYEKMYNIYNINHNEEWNRKTFKSFFMRAYFDSEIMLSAHIKREIGLRVEYKKDEWKDVDNIMRNYRKSVVDIIGEGFDSEIFYHESCIYMDVLKELLEKGYDVLQIYDGFYMNKECTDIQEIVKDKAMKYYKEVYKKYNKEYKESNKEECKDKGRRRDTIVEKFDNKEEDDELINKILLKLQKMKNKKGKRKFLFYWE